MPQVKADILEREIRALTITETGAFAAALLAGQAIGVYTDLETTVDQLIKPRKVFSPSAKNRDLYRSLYGIYKELYPALKDIHSKLSSL
jgi:xylulokinase